MSMKSIPVLQNQYDHSKLSPHQVRSWARLNKLVRKYQQEEILQHLLSGSEALERYADELEVLPSSQCGTDIWLSSSGYKLTAEKALAYKRAGLVGVTLCLDHFDPEKHNELQRYKHAYGWVLKAADSIRSAGLLLGFKLTPTPNFISKQNLFSYVRLAKMQGGSYVQIMEPLDHEQTGNRYGQIDTTHRVILDEFAQTINYEPEFKSWPTINLTSLVQFQEKRNSAPLPSLYIDAAGKLQMC
jgi:molybdenum cofactor biosynthesis enzyme MoaA